MVESGTSELIHVLGTMSVPSYARKGVAFSEVLTTDVWELTSTPLNMTYMV